MVNKKLKSQIKIDSEQHAGIYKTTYTDDTGSTVECEVWARAKKDGIYIKDCVSDEFKLVRIENVELGPGGDIVEPVDGTITLPYVTYNPPVDLTLREMYNGSKAFENTYIDFNEILTIFDSIYRNNGVGNLVITFNDSINEYILTLTLDVDIIDPSNYNYVFEFDSATAGATRTIYDGNNGGWQLGDYDNTKLHYNGTTHVMTIDSGKYIGYEYTGTFHDSESTQFALDDGLIFHHVRGIIDSGIVKSFSETININDGILEVKQPLPQPVTGDNGYVPAVKSDLSGYELVPQSGGDELKVRDGDLHLEYSNVSHTEGNLNLAGSLINDSTYIFESVIPTSNLRETTDELLASYINAWGIDNGAVKFGMMDLRNFSGDPTDTSTFEFTLIDNFIDSNPYFILEDDAAKLNATSPESWNGGGVYYFLTTCSSLEDILNNNGPPLNITIDSGVYQFYFDLNEKTLFSKVLLRQIDNAWNLFNQYSDIGLKLEGFEDSSQLKYDYNLSRIATEHVYLNDVIVEGAYIHNLVLADPWYGSGQPNFRIEGEGGKFIEFNGYFEYDLYGLFSTDGVSTDSPVENINASVYTPFNIGLGRITNVTGTIPNIVVSQLDDVQSLKMKLNDFKTDVDDIITNDLCEVL